MTFIANAQDIAKHSMNGIDPALADKYATIIAFLSDNPAYAVPLSGKNAPAIGSADYVEKHAKKFYTGRAIKSPKKPDTTPDRMVDIILESHFKVPPDNLKIAEELHRLAMGAENIIGHLLECYIAQRLEPTGWVWCSGSGVKAIDFIYRDAALGWIPLQVKNRDNSENSSSSAIRNGTPIQKWHRTFSKKPGDNWANFPNVPTQAKMSEQDFEAFIRDYLSRLP